MKKQLLSLILLLSGILISCDKTKEDITVQPLSNKSKARITSDLVFYNLASNPTVLLAPFPAWPGVKYSYGDLSTWIKNNQYRVDGGIWVGNDPNQVLSNPVFWVGYDWDIYRKQGETFVLVYDGNSLTDVLDRLEYIRINGTAYHQEAVTKGWVFWGQPF